MMSKSLTVLALALICILPGNAQVKKTQPDMKREVTLYNPYKPALFDVKKKSYLPDIIDTVRIVPSFSYQVESQPFSPTYTISPIKPAALLSDPLNRLYKGYVKIGVGNNTTPLAEISVSGTRSKKGAVGIYLRHYSSNGTVPLPNTPRVFAGLMDNNASLYGKKFFNKNLLNISLDYEGKTRYAYGYKTDDPYYIYVPIKKDIKTGYFNVGAKASFSSLNLDSTAFSYNFKISYDFFRESKYYFMNHAGISGVMAKLYKDFYVGSGIMYDHYKLSDSIDLKPKYIFSASPFVRKSSDQWGFNLGVNLVLERNLTSNPKLYFYPDLKFGFTIVPEYLRFFAELSGKLENNNPVKVFSENPYLKPGGSIFKVPNTSYPLIIAAGFKGNNGIGGNYVASVSYSLINDMLLFSNIVHPDTASRIERGNHFILVPDDAEVLNFHGEINGNLGSKLSFNTAVNIYKYTLSANEFAWNKPNWDSKLGLTYNLRNKIIAGVEITGLGKRTLMMDRSPTGWTTLSPSIIEKPVHFNLGLSAEYRYTKILSFWFKMNNISYNRYYEWAYYPSQMFNFLIGFSYSL